MAAVVAETPIIEAADTVAAPTTTEAAPESGKRGLEFWEMDPTTTVRFISENRDIEKLK